LYIQFGGEVSCLREVQDSGNADDALARLSLFRKLATIHRTLLREMTCKDKAFYASSPLCSRGQEKDLAVRRRNTGENGTAETIGWWIQRDTKKVETGKLRRGRGNGRLQTRIGSDVLIQWIEGLACVAMHVMIIELAVGLMHYMWCAYMWCAFLNLHTAAKLVYRVMKIHRMPYLTAHFPHKSPMISGSFAENDLQLKVSYGASPPCMMIQSNFSCCLIRAHMFDVHCEPVDKHETLFIRLDCLRNHRKYTHILLACRFSYLFANSLYFLVSRLTLSCASVLRKYVCVCDTTSLRAVCVYVCMCVCVRV